MTANSTLQATSENGVLRVVMDNPPVNVLGAVMMLEVRDLLAAFREDSSVKVIVFESANPEFFLAHVDIQIADRMDVLPDLAYAAAETAGLGQVEALMGYGQGLIAENDAWVGLVGLPTAQRIMSTAMASGAQTPDGERDLEAVLRTIAAQEV